VGFLYFSHFSKENALGYLEMHFVFTHHF